MPRFLIKASLSYFPILLAIPLLAEAGGHECSSVALLAEKVFDCDRNAHFAREAIRCAESFSKEVDTTSNALAKRLNASVRRGMAESQAQINTQKVTEKSMDRSELLFSELIAKGKSSESKLNTYLANLRLPITWPKDQPRPSLFDPELIELFQDEKCFSANRAVVMRSLADIQQMLHELEQSRTRNTALKQRSQSRQSNLSSTKRIPARKTATASAAPGAPDFKGKKQLQRVSTITSRKELQK